MSMAPEITVTIEGLQEAQARNQRRIALLKTSGTRRVLQMAAAELQRHAIAINPVDTGSWRASHRIELGDDWSAVYVDPSATNSRTGVRVLDYASEWEAEGADYAVYKRTVREAGPRVLKMAAQQLAMEVRNA